MQPKRVATVTITILSPMYDWRSVTDRQLRQRWNQAVALGSTVTTTLYYRLYSPDPGFGAPYALSQNWTFTLDIYNSDFDYIINGITANISSATESVTVPAGTFTCYNLTITQGNKTIIEYWDASGVFPYAPVKVVDNVNFDSTDTRVLYSSTVLP